jgi:hypothetical protein
LSATSDRSPLFTDPAPSWSEGQVAGLALIASSLVGHLLPNPFGPLLARVPWIASAAVMLAFPLVVMIPVLAGMAARVSWYGSLWKGLRFGIVVPFLAALVMQAAFVLSLALGQPQLLRIGFGWESLRDVTLVLLTTTATGAALAFVGGAAGALARVALRGADVSLSR